MRVDVIFLPQELETRSLDQAVAVIIDVLRASSTIATALANGCEELIPTQTVEEAVEMARSYGRGDFLLGGERKGNKIEGFDLGNSPAEYVPDRVKGKKIIFTTTNGTAVIKAAKGASAILIGSFLNLEAITQYALGLGRDIVFVCAGDGRRFALEDAVCAGMMCDYVCRVGDNVVESDSCIAARKIYDGFNGRISDALAMSEHGRYLEHIGLGADLGLCGQTNVLDVIPCMSEGHIVRRAPQTP
ncbi:MAG TPA: 2-phosphosulfolactate phosphatase [Firmicutes bacterium]|nr:2-phosphosulfolactate phosphatase [Bacillota bacterium]